MMAGVSTETEHPWDDQRSPVAKTVNRPRAIDVIYQRFGGGWRAISPDIRRMKDYDDDLPALDRRVRARLTRRYPADVRINYRVDRLQEPDTTNANVVFMHGEGPLPVSQGRPSRRRPRSVAALEIERQVAL